MSLPNPKNYIAVKDFDRGRVKTLPYNRYLKIGPTN